MTGPYIYKLIYWNEVEEKEETVSGILFADGFVGAMQIIDEYYDKDLIEILGIKEYEERPVLELPDDIITEIQKYI